MPARYLLPMALLLSACAAETTAPTATPIAPPDAARATLPLPPFPALPAVETLSESSAGELTFPTRSPYDMDRVYSGYDTLERHSGLGTLYLPDGASAARPAPAMVILHGSGGIKDGREHDYAELFANAGVAGFVVDYYRPRGVTDDTPYQFKTMIATEVDVLADAFSALDFLRTHPAIDGTRIGVTGYSYGGMATRYAADARLVSLMTQSGQPFALHMDIYGPCHQITGNASLTGAPYLAIHGDADNSVDPALCQSVYADMSAAGMPVESLVIPGAGHAWENADAQAEFTEGSYITGCTFSWDPDTGAFLINGQPGPKTEPDMTRAERAGVRAGLGPLAGPCVGQGYTVGRNEQADRISKARQLAFLRREFGL